MLNDLQKQRLFKNWGPSAEALDCNAEVRVYDPLSKWECYLVAINPENEDEMTCIIKAHNVGIATDLTFSLLKSMYNSSGEGVIVDQEFRRRRAGNVLKKLME